MNCLLPEKVQLCGTDFRRIVGHCDPSTGDRAVLRRDILFLFSTGGRCLPWWNNVSRLQFIPAILELPSWISALGSWPVLNLAFP